MPVIEEVGGQGGNIHTIANSIVMPWMLVACPVAFCFFCALMVKINILPLHARRTGNINGAKAVWVGKLTGFGLAGRITAF